MAIQSFSFPTNIRFGAGCIDELPAYLKGMGLARPIIITDSQVSQLSFFGRIIDRLESGDLEVEVFDQIHSNPVQSDVSAGCETYKVSHRDCIVGIGGGAAMDVARAVTLKINHPRDLFDYDELVGGTQYITEPVPHFVTIPTTSGTGSEVGRAAIISEDDTKRKRILFHPKLMAKQVFADPELTYDLPANITAATGMDALTHNLEAFVSKGWHPMAEGIALQGMKLISESIEVAVTRPDPESRSKMMMGSLMGAVAFQKGLGLVHSLSHPLSTLLDMHHGLANAINLAYGVRFNYAGNELAFEQVGKALGLQSVSQQNLVEKLFKLNEAIGLPGTLGEVGVKSEHIEPLTELALQDFCLPSNPKPVGKEDFQSLYRQAIG